MWVGIGRQRVVGGRATTCRTICDVSAIIALHVPTQLSRRKIGVHLLGVFDELYFVVVGARVSDNVGYGDGDVLPEVVCPRGRQAGQGIHKFVDATTCDRSATSRRLGRISGVVQQSAVEIAVTSALSNIRTTALGEGAVGIVAASKIVRGIKRLRPIGRQRGRPISSSTSGRSIGVIDRRRHALTHGQRAQEKQQRETKCLFHCFTSPCLFCAAA